MAQDRVLYLNRQPALMSGTLVRAVEGLPSKMQKAPPGQWTAAIKSLVAKGEVKQAELDDAELLAWLQAHEVGNTRSLTREQVVDQAKSRQVTIKEVTLGETRWRGYSHANLVPGSQYDEILLIANSERANIADRIEEIDWEIEEYNFQPEKLSTDPEGIFRLEAERKALVTQKDKAWDFRQHHFTEAAGRHGTNLIAHGRVTVVGDTFLVEELQSDWGQRGRRADWNGIPKGPFVTDTKLWAGLLMRRLMQRAALNPAIKRVAWIRGSMRNGGKQVMKDNLDEFYVKVVGGIVDKVIGKAGGKARLDTLRLGAHSFADVPMFDMTDDVRESLKGVLPLYSLTGLRARPAQLDEPARLGLLARVEQMLGSVAHFRLVNHIYDIATGREVAGRYVNRLVQVSLNAADPEYVTDHECFHFAEENLLFEHEKRIVQEAFRPGSELNQRTYSALMARGERAAGAQCLQSASEAAAHGFALWARGELEVRDQAVEGIFSHLKVVAQDALAWFKRAVMGYRATNAEEVFSALVNGERAAAPASRARQREAA